MSQGVFVPGGFCPRGILSVGILSQGDFVQGDFVLQSREHEVVIRKNKRTLQCNYCDNKFGTKDSLNTHCQNVHQIMQHLQCNQCRAFFNNNKDLQEHVRNVHMLVKIDCWTCGKMYNSKYLLQNHIKTEHRNQNRYLYDNRQNRYQWHEKDSYISSGHV